MKFIFLYFSFVSVFFSTGPNFQPRNLRDARYNVLPPNTHIFYTTQNSKIEGKGSITAAKGELTLDGLKLISANIEFNVSSISCSTDDSLKNKQVIQMLTSHEFFNIQKYPKIFFTLSKNKNNDIISYLTINGKTIQYNCNTRVAEIGHKRIAILIEPFVLKLGDFYNEEDGSQPENKNSLIISIGITASEIIT